VALGPVDENGLGHLGLSACSAKTGELLHSPPVHGSPAETGELAPEVRVPIWGIGGGGAHRGGLTVAKQIGGGELAMAGWRRGGGQQLRVRGAAVSLGGGHCGEGGAHRWPEWCSTGRRPAWCFDGFLQRTVAQRPAWRGLEAHESGAGWWAIRCLEQRSTAMREQRRQ
jgi:hypothetical protein